MLRFIFLDEYETVIFNVIVILTLLSTILIEDVSEIVQRFTTLDGNGYVFELMFWFFHYDFVWNVDSVEEFDYRRFLLTLIDNYEQNYFTTISLSCNVECWDIDQTMRDFIIVMLFQRTFRLPPFIFYFVILRFVQYHLSIYDLQLYQQILKESKLMWFFYYFLHQLKFIMFMIEQSVVNVVWFNDRFF